jgi:dCMP deaminase
MKTINDWDTYYMNIVDAVAAGSYAKDKKVGAVIVRNGNIISTSYNGTVPGANNETEVDGVTKLEVLHAEQAAICKAAKLGNRTEGAILYCTLAPCIHCAKLIVMAGINEVVYKQDYKDMSGVVLMQDSYVLVRKHL